MMTVVNKTTVVAGTRNTVATMANARKGAMAPAVPCAMKVRGIQAKADGAANTVAANLVAANLVAAANMVAVRTVDGRDPVAKIMAPAGQAQAAKASLVVGAGRIRVADPMAAMVVAAGQVRIANLKAVMVAAKTVAVRQAGVANPMAAAAKITTAAHGTEIEATKAADMAAALRSAAMPSGVSAKPRVAILEITTIRTTPHRGTCTVTRSEEHTSELQSQSNLVCRLLL